jgi:hypothetical protein
MSQENVVKACIIPPVLRDQLTKLDEEDEKANKEVIIERIIKTFGVDHEPVIRGLGQKDDDDMFSTLDYICCMYVQPLQPSMKISLRRRVVSLVENCHLTDKEVEFMWHVLAHYGCMSRETVHH